MDLRRSFRAYASRPRPPWLSPTLALGAAVVLLAAAWAIAHRARVGPSVATATVVAGPALNPQTEAFLRAQIEPLLAESAKLDRAAIERAVATLHERFEGFRAGADPFARDVSGWGTRFGVLGRSVGDTWAHWWRGDMDADAVGSYVQAKFRKHVLSEEALAEAVIESLVQFREDLAANQNALFSQVQSRLRAAEAPTPDAVIDFGRFERRLVEHTDRLLADLGRHTLVSGAGALTGSIIAEEITRRVAYAILARLGTSLLSSAAATGASAAGATGAGAAAGATGGTTLGPAGTVVGFGIGIAVGVAVDWWMTARFEAELRRKCEAFLDETERGLVEGAGGAAGLRAVLEEAASLAERSQRIAVLTSVREVSP